MTTAHIRAHWGPRGETADSAAAKVQRLQTVLAETSPLLSGWRDQAFSKKKALTQPVVTLSDDDLRKRLLAGRIPGDAPETTGSAVSWWNAAEEAAAAVLFIRVGITSPKMGTNGVTLRLPDSDKAPGLYTPDTGGRLLSAIIDIFTPDRAVWITTELEKLQKEPNRPLPDGSVEIVGIIGQPAGWATYLRHDQAPSFNTALIPDTASVETIAGGTLVTLGGDPAHPAVNDIFAVRAAMGYAVAPYEEPEAAAPAASPAPGPSTAPEAKPQERQAPSANQTNVTGEAARPTGEQ